ncbi:hypothetical protein Q9966_013402 [Columba livia]|nr:hypothetical protein Q9966_013402 [Columba livia]
MKSALRSSSIDYVVLFKAKKGIWYHLVIKDAYERANFLDSGATFQLLPVLVSPRTSYTSPLFCYHMLPCLKRKRFLQCGSTCQIGTGGVWRVYDGLWSSELPGSGST